MGYGCCSVCFTSGNRRFRSWSEVKPTAELWFSPWNWAPDTVISARKIHLCSVPTADKPSPEKKSFSQRGKSLELPSATENAECMLSRRGCVYSTLCLLNIWSGKIKWHLLSRDSRLTGLRDKADGNIPNCNFSNVCCLQIPVSVSPLTKHSWSCQFSFELGSVPAASALSQFLALCWPEPLLLSATVDDTDAASRTFLHYDNGRGRDWAQAMCWTPHIPY